MRGGLSMAECDIKVCGEAKVAGVCGRQDFSLALVLSRTSVAALFTCD